jgi:mRNA-degrading endonuclease RelE of RelBE toxin-antitoxin system
MNEYSGIFHEVFSEYLQQYAGKKEQIQKKVKRVLMNPYHNTERLDAQHEVNLKGCRSIKIDRNFRIIFVVCEECRRVSECQYCFCEDLPDKTVVFLMVGPHKKAYKMK